MAELEVKYETRGRQDKWSKRVGILSAVLAVLVCFIEVLEHRAETLVKLYQEEHDDKIQSYASARENKMFREMENLVISSLSTNQHSLDIANTLAQQAKKYDFQGKAFEEDVIKLEHEGEDVERAAYRYGLANSLLSLALVFTSLYFLSKRLLFPILGAALGCLSVFIVILAILF